MDTLSSHRDIPRRDFLGLLAAGGLAFMPRVAGCTAQRTNAMVTVHLFSKHIQWLDYNEMAEAVARIGFDGVDLTVRPGGHVLPERVAEDLPRAVEALHAHGLKADLMTTAITDPQDETSRTVLRVAADQGIRYYRTGWLRHPDDGSILESLAHCRQQMGRLARLNEEIGIRGSYQNHAGNYVGASIWELRDLLEDIDPAWLGCQYDIRHATVEGGLSWPQGLRLIHPYINTLVLKDVRWGEVDGRWGLVDTPMEEGMVDFPRYLGLLKQYGIQAPVSLHLEYPLGGAEHGGTPTIPSEEVFRAMAQDLTAVRRLWSAA